MSKSINENLYHLATNIDDIQNRIDLIKEIINRPNFNERELISNLNLAQERLTKTLIQYLYGKANTNKRLRI